MLLSVVIVIVVYESICFGIVFLKTTGKPLIGFNKIKAGEIGK